MFRKPKFVGAGGVLWLVLVGIGSQLPAEDWLTYRCDAGRSGSSPEQLPGNLVKIWDVQVGLPYIGDLMSGKDNPGTDVFDSQSPAPAPSGRSVATYPALEPIVIGNTLVAVSPQNGLVTALETGNGERKWQYDPGASVHFTPIADGQGNIYITANDGSIHCISDEDGTPLWNFDVADLVRSVSKNRSDVSVLPICGGPLIAGDKLCFAVGGWPFEGAFLCTVDLAGVQEEQSSPSRNAIDLSEVNPQGYLVASDEDLFIPCGLAIPRRYNLGEQVFVPLQYDTLGLAQDQISASGSWLVQGNLVVDRTTFATLSLGASRPVISGSKFFFIRDQRIVAAQLFPAIDSKSSEEGEDQPPHFKILWQLSAAEIPAALDQEARADWRPGPLTVDILVGSRLFGRFGNAIFAVDVPQEEDEAQQSQTIRHSDVSATMPVPEVSWTVVEQGELTTLIAADNKLYATMRDGRILAYQQEQGGSHSAIGAAEAVPDEVEPEELVYFTETGLNISMLPEYTERDEDTGLQLTSEEPIAGIFSSDDSGWSPPVLLPPSDPPPETDVISEILSPPSPTPPSVSPSLPGGGFPLIPPGGGSSGGGGGGGLSGGGGGGGLSGGGGGGGGLSGGGGGGGGLSGGGGGGGSPSPGGPLGPSPVVPVGPAPPVPPPIAVPEPWTVPIFVIGLLGLGLVRWRRRPA